MTSMGPSPAETRFHVELSASGHAGIRDKATGRLYPAASVADAYIDAAYVNRQHQSGNHAEVATHLESVAELAATGKTASEPPSPSLVPPALILAAAAEWAAARARAHDVETSRRTADGLRTLRRDLVAADARYQLSAAQVGAAVRRLYADPDSAHRVLADTSTAMDLPPLADLAETAPTLFGELAPVPAARFGPAAASAETGERARALADAIRDHHESRTALHALTTTASSTLGHAPDTPSDALARALDERISSFRPSADPHPHDSLPRCTDRLRALLSLTNQKTRDAVLRRHPETAQTIREARAHSPTTVHDRTP